MLTAAVDDLRRWQGLKDVSSPVVFHHPVSTEILNTTRAASDCGSDNTSSIDVSSLEVDFNSTISPQSGSRTVLRYGKIPECIFYITSCSKILFNDLSIESPADNHHHCSIPHPRLPTRSQTTNRRRLYSTSLPSSDTTKLNS